MKKLTCDKPYNLDEARKKNGLSRRKRDDPRTTAYELVIRIPDEYQELAAKKKYSKTVYALNKKTDLKQQQEQFEDEKTQELQALIDADTVMRAKDEVIVTALMPLGSFLQYYIDVRVNSVGAASIKNERRFRRYLVETIEEVPLRNLTSDDVERAVLAVPSISERWAIERRQAREKNRRTADWAKRHKTLVKPFKEIKVAGPDTQHKVLKFLREALNFAVDKEILGRNVAKAKFLTRIFKKSKPLIDPFMEDEAGLILKKIEMLPTSYDKVAFLILLNTGIRPEEVQAVRPGNFSFIDGEPCLSITGIVEHGTNYIKNYEGKSNAALRSIPIDDYTYNEALKWMDLLKAELAEKGIRFTLNTPLISTTGSPITYNTLNNHWEEFMRSSALEYRRMYALRHTFATITLAHGENLKTVSYLMGHESTAYTTDLYAAWVPNTRTGIGRRYMETLRKAA